MKPFEWMNARSESEAAKASRATVAAAMVARTDDQALPDAIVVKAGGIDVLDLMKEGLLHPRRLVNLRGVAGLTGFAPEKSGGLRIGALTTIAQIAGHSLIRQSYAALGDACAQLASPQIRNVATLGGNLLQRPQCWYFRSASHHCARKGGEHCFAFGGENHCHAIFDQRGCAIVHPSTAATALVALDAKVELRNAEGKTRMLALEEFFVLPDRDIHSENDLKSGEILAAVLLPKPVPRARSVHLKQGEKDSFDWPIADVAVLLERDEAGICRKASIVLGAASPVPHRAAAAEAALRDKDVREETAREAARAALSGAAPLSKNAYKLPIFETLVRRAILAAAAG